MEANTVSTGKDEEVRRQILQAGKRLFQLYGFRKVTIDDIARAVGKARSSLYYYYKTKEEVLEAVIADEIRELMDTTAAAVIGVSDVGEKIKAFFLTLLKIILEKRGFFNALDEGMDAAEITGFQKTRLAVHQELRKREGALLEEILLGGIQREELAGISQDDREDLVFALLGGLHGIKREMVIKNDFSRMEGSVQILVHSVINGLKK